MTFFGPIPIDQERKEYLDTCLSIMKATKLQEEETGMIVTIPDDVGMKTSLDRDFYRMQELGRKLAREREERIINAVLASSGK